MKRREFVGLVAAAWPFAARAQVAGKVWRIGVLGGGPLSVLSQNYSGFLRGMRELGYIEGKDFVSELRAADNSYERLSSLADEMVRIGADVLLTSTAAAMPALQKATRTIPIVMAGISDPVGSGFIVSLARPGGNTTGVASNRAETAPKQLELLAAMVSNPSRIGLLGNPENQSLVSVLRYVREAARLIGGIVETSASFEARSAPRSYPTGEDLQEFNRQAATFVHKLMRGAKPADLPVELPTRYHLTINRKTADALGLTIPPLLYIFADEVIE